MKVRMLGIYCRTSRDESTSGIKTIVQQKELGVKFAKDNGWDYEVYEDAGKSGFKYEDEENPFKERKAFQKLLNDIADKKVTDVWVWENSRLSREHYAQALVYRIFEQNNIILWENGRKYDLHQPTDKLTKTILDAVAEYERQEIVLRTSRGQRASFNKGKNRHGSLYGYVTDRNTRITSPVPEELKTAKKIFEEYLSGKNLREIGREHFTDGNPATAELLSRVKKVRQILAHEEYTGDSLKMSGRAIEADFRAGKGADLQELRKDEYWVKSVFYTEKIIDRETWIKANEKLEWTRRSLAKPSRKASRETNNSLASGLLRCATCNCNYYYKNQKSRGGLTYYHVQTIDRCTQKPAQVQIKYFDTILDVFFTFYYLVFDDTADRLRQMKLEVRKNSDVMNRQLKELEKQRNQAQKGIDNINEMVTQGLFNDNKDAFVEAMSSRADFRKQVETLTNEIRLKNLEIEENSKKDSELTRDEKYQLGTIERIQKWFELREKNSYTELRIMLREVLFDGFITIDGNCIEIMSGDPARTFYFDVRHDYNIIYPFIEKVINRDLHKQYTRLEQIWLDGKADILGTFGDRVNAFLKQRPSRNPEELFKDGDFLFLTDCFNVNWEEFGLNVYTAEEVNLTNEHFYTTEQVSELLSVPKSTLREWAHKHDVHTYMTQKGIKTLIWSEADVELYKTSPHKHIGNKGYKFTPEQLAHLSKVRTGKKHSEESKRKRSEAMKKRWAELSDEERANRKRGLDPYNRTKK